MSTYSLQVPDGLKANHCEKPGCDYREVPIRYIMPQILEDEVRTTSFKLPDKNIMYYTVFDDGNAEMYIRMLKDHESLVSLNGSVPALQAAQKQFRVAHAAYAAIKRPNNPTTAQVALAATRLDERKAAHKALQVIYSTAFSQFRRLLDGAAKERWDNIDKEVHEDDSHTALDGTTVDKKKYRSWKSFEFCLDKHKEFVFANDAADQTRRYLQQGIRKPFEVKIKYFMQRVQAINRNLPFMPCLALYSEATEETVPTNIPLNGTEICDVILRSLTSEWQAQYKVSTGQATPTKPEKLLKQLEAIEKIMDQKAKDKNPHKKDSPAKSGKSGTSSEKRRSSTGPGNSPRVHKKQKTEKFCNRCKDKGGRYQTHNTNDCAKYNADLTPNKSYGSNYTKSKNQDSGGGKGKSHNKKWGNDKQQISHVTAALDKVKKQMKKLKKSSGMKRKRHSRHHSSSDESSSGSDSL